MIKATFVIGALCSVASLVAAPVTVFTTDFDSGVPPEISGVTTTTGVQGYSGVGFSGNFLQNTTLGSPTTLTLTGLAPHTSVDLNFLLAVIDSWDGVAPSGVAPDFFNIEIDGTPIVQSFSVFDSANQSILAGTTELAYNTALGFNGGWNDSAYDFSTTPSLTFAHTSNTLTINFFSSGSGFQGFDDESWAIDNLSVTIDTTDSTDVPDAGASVALLGLALCGIAGFKRR